MLTHATPRRSSAMAAASCRLSDISCWGGGEGGVIHIGIAEEDRPRRWRAYRHFWPCEQSQPARPTRTPNGMRGPCRGSREPGLRWLRNQNGMRGPCRGTHTRRDARGVGGGARLRPAGSMREIETTYFDAASEFLTK